MATFKITVSQYGDEVRVQASCEIEDRLQAQATAAGFPKSTLVRYFPGSGPGSRTYGSLHFQADMNAASAVARYRRFRKALPGLALDVEFATPFKNSLTEDELEKFLAGELKFEKPVSVTERIKATEPTEITVTLNLFGEQREVTVEGYVSYHDHPGTIWRASVYGLVGTIGRGAARYPTTLLLNRLYDGESAFRRGTVVTDQLGRKWTYHLGTVIRNRQAQIVGWKDTVGATNYQTQERTS